MTGILWAALGLLGGLAMTALGGMASQEIRDRLDHLPHAILRLAARRLTPTQRVTVYEEEWLPELTYILKGAEARPITRLITGTWYALGILASAGRISPRLDRPPAEQTNSFTDPAENGFTSLVRVLDDILTNRNNVAHGDLKLQNVVLGGDPGQVALIDYSEVRLTLKKGKYSEVP